MTRSSGPKSISDQRWTLFFETTFQDVRHALRGLRRSPGFAFTAVLTLAMGIGATTAIFSAVYALLIKPLPYRDPDRLVWVTEHWPRASGIGAIAQPDMVAWRERGQPFESVAGYAFDERTLTGSGDAVRVSVAPVTANFLSVLGVTPQLGHDFAAADDHPGGPAVALLSDSFWRERFSSDPAAVGKSINLDREAYTIVGVLPRNFRFPDLTIAPQIMVPLRAPASSAFTMQAPVIMFQVIGRIPVRQLLSQTQRELQSFQNTRLHSYPPPIARMLEGGKVEIAPLQRHLAGDSRTPVLILLAAVGFVLLIACANIANLQLVRAAARRHEIAVRGALGAARARLARQFLTESMAVAGLAAFSGLIIAEVGIRVIRGWHSAELPWLDNAGMNLYVFAFSMAISFAAAVFFGTAPAITGSRTNLGDALKGAPAAISAIRDHRLLRNSFVIAEVALALVLLIAAGLLVRSFRRLMSVDPGYDQHNVLTASVQPPPPEGATNGFKQMPAPDYTPVLTFAADLLPRLQALPGVRYAGLADALPLIHGNHKVTVVWLGATAPPQAEWRQSAVSLISITPDFFRAMGTPMIQGRAFSDSDNDTAPAVAIVNQAFVRKFLSGKALGARFHSVVPERCAGCRPGAGTELEVVGLVTDVHQQGLEQAAEPEIYLPFAQSPPLGFTIVLGTSGPPAGLAASLRSTVVALSRAVPLYNVATLEERLSESTARRRLTMFLLSTFAVLALLLAALGIYGVISYAVMQRTHEIGIRVALGATRGRVLLLVMRQQAQIVLIGVISGLALARSLTGVMSSLLYSVKPHDFMTFAVSSVMLVLVAMLGSAAPALHATRSDPCAALRYE